ncbi:MAG: RNA 2',3'-cyclic phosphodiesterase [Hyphomonadaceae bacterium]|nr:RNA 2',3'-cyclic phosphodiesterase [Hyphomonadaceae bacterium]
MSLRLFAALTLPEHVVDRVDAVQRGAPGAFWTPDDNLHITLRFFGDTPEPIAEDLDVALEHAALSARPFELRLKGAGVFGKEEPHTLWLGVDPLEPVKTLAADCERAARSAGLKPEPRKFAPHVTIAKLRGVDRVALIGVEKRLALFESPSWRVETMTLFSSQVRRGEPSLYTIEAEYPLGG